MESKITLAMGLNEAAREIVRRLVLENRHYEVFLGEEDSESHEGDLETLSGKEILERMRSRIQGRVMIYGPVSNGNGSEKYGGYLVEERRIAK